MASEDANVFVFVFIARSDGRLIKTNIETKISKSTVAESFFTPLPTSIVKISLCDLFGILNGMHHLLVIGHFWTLFWNIQCYIPFNCTRNRLPG